MKNNRRLQSVLEIGLMLVAVLGSLYLLKQVAVFDFPKPATGRGEIFLYLGLFVIAFLALGLHELGHLLMGLVQGFKFRLFVVGPLGVKREKEKTEWYFNTNLSYYGGVASTIPSTAAPDNGKKFARILLAGPIASLVGAGALLWLSIYLSSPWNTIVFAGGAISLALFFATTIPSRTGSFFTDRKRYQRLMRPGKTREIELAILRIIGQYTEDDSYANVATADIDLLLTDDDPFIIYYGWFNKLYQQLEQGNEPSAEQWAAFEAIGESVPKSTRQSMEKMLKEVDISTEKSFESSRD